MGLLLFFLSIAIFVLIAILLLTRKKGTRAPTSSPSRKVVKQPEIVSESSIEQPQHEKTTQHTISANSHLVFPKVTYSPLGEGICPTHLENVDKKTKNKINKKVSDLRPLPAASSKLYSLLRTPDSSAKEITAVVSTNPILSAKILRTVNSAYYSLPEKISSVGRAIILLGYNNVRSLVYQDTMQYAFSGEQNKDAGFNELWTHSTVVSACALYLGQNVFRYSENDLATIGLLHDMGKYFLQLLKSKGEKGENIPTIIHEEKQYGINHALIGSLIVKNWQLPDTITKSIEFHHYPIFLPPESIPEPFRKLSFIVCLSDLICKVLGYTCQSDEILPIRSEYFKMFGLSTELQATATRTLIREIEKARSMVESFISTS